MTDIDTRRRRAVYRASHRGTKEMDWLLGRYGEAHLPAMGEADLVDFERLLALPDPDLQTWIMTGAERSENDLSALVHRIRIFHGLTDGRGVSLS
jgi:antitoxin CptB